MPDYSKYEIPSPDMYHSVFADCRACLDSIITDEEFTVKELLEAIDEHEKSCDPKIWLYRHGYIQETEYPDGVINRYEHWFQDEPMTESEKVAKEEEIKNYIPHKTRLTEFVRRHW
jgi:hypothetical protein